MTGQPSDNDISDAAKVEYQEFTKRLQVLLGKATSYLKDVKSKSGQDESATKRICIVENICEMIQSMLLKSPQFVKIKPSWNRTAKRRNETFSASSNNHNNVSTKEPSEKKQRGGGKKKLLRTFFDSFRLGRESRQSEEDH